VKDLQKSEQRRIVRNAAEPDWSWDGRKLAFVRGNDVWIVDLASKRTRRLIRDAHAPHWSPDGSHIAFERSGDVRTQIYIADDDGRNQQRVAVAESPAWSPDGHELAASEFSRIIRIRLDGTHRRVVYSGRAGRHDDCCAYREIEWVAG